jgi:hypothetical protein
VVKSPSKAAFGANDSDLKKNPASILTDSATNCNMFAKKYLKILENSLKFTIKSDYPAKIAKKLVFSLKITQNTLQISQKAGGQSSSPFRFWCGNTE